MRTILSISKLTTAAMAVVTILAGSQSDAAPAEGLTAFSFLMARPYGEPVPYPVMGLISFKPSDGPKFRETFEKKHGPKGRDLIDSLGRGSYRTVAAEDQNATLAVVAFSEASSGKSSAIKKPSESHWSKQRFEQNA